ncbi:STAS domain-containing protein [Lentibacter sp. XHP0401]|jgi:anti-sigma B factor antagonist|uniref:STAS domain-containing protein n=1 Tax=Lentibacter sp. XHP0401 TaxID=2984334 RepID=UPI0021E6FEC1|nr:STAS domain-containing protein [Lentibacter sp. XHP0401]MCV2892491.1 STAS domain-containing protein [Lentibacter sp. XHP0401]
MKFDCRETSDLLFVKVLAERIDAAAALKFKDSLREFTGQAKASHVVLDLSEVGFIDSSGLGAVVAVMKLMGSTKRLDLAGLTPTVEKVFRLTRMDSIFTIHAQAEDVNKLYKAG